MKKCHVCLGDKKLHEIYKGIELHVVKGVPLETQKAFVDAMISNGFYLKVI